ncbi:MAG TPA: YdeI/OmpD-associated family protein [Thermoanaerobaculia bacterium]|nr:YdeI/OmpD-associated family protein [Thermoanaerobaculia bacterium]
MGKRDRRVDAYIEKSADFAKPILNFLRDVLHTAVPDVEETMKWSVPFFEYKGPLANMAAFKAHCAFGFWKSSLVGTQRFDRIESLDDLPSKRELIALAKKAAKLNDEGVKVERKKLAPKKDIPPPPELVAALEKNKKAQATFDNFSPSHRREYVQWIAEAKAEETRKRRIDQAIEWLSEGKPRNWKYMKTR